MEKALTQFDVGHRGTAGDREDRDHPEPDRQHRRGAAQDGRHRLVRNTAVDNVRDKLDELGFAHMLANLGRKEKRAEFFAGQAARNT